MNANLSRLLEWNRHRYGDKDALVYGDQRITYRALDAQVNALARGLLDLGLERGDKIALLGLNSAPYIVTFLAISKIGAVVLPLNYRLAADELAYIVSHGEAKALVTEAELQALALEFLPATRVQVVISMDPVAPPGWVSTAELMAANPGAMVPDAEVNLNDLQRLMYTSGTTARPKGVMLSHGNVVFKHLAHTMELGLTSAERMLIAGPLYHVGGMDCPGLSMLCNGGTIVIMRRFDPREMLRIVQQERITGLWLVGSMFNMITDLPDRDAFDTSAVRWVLIGGQKIVLPQLLRLREVFPQSWFTDCYGMTETVGGDTFLDQANALRKVGSVGRPVIYTDLRVVDDDDHDVPVGELGEVIMRGPKVCLGYWRDPEATAQAFRNGWFHTGDIGRLDEDGYLYIEDRQKDMIRSGGENIASPEVERVLYEHPAVLEAAVVGVPDDKWGEVVKAFVVLRPGAAATAGELTEHCTDKLARFKVPRYFAFIAALPRNPSGKVLKRVLRTGEGS